MDTQKAKIPFYAVRSFGEKINTSFDFIKENWKVLLKYSTYLILPIALLQALSLNTVVSGYMGLAFIDSYDVNPETFGVKLIASYFLTMLFAVLGYLLISSLVFALIKIYNEREGGLQGITFAEIKPVLFRNMGRLFLLGFIGAILVSLIIVVIGLLAWLTLFTLLLTIPALFAFLIAFSMWAPVYLFEEIDFGNSLAKGLRLGFLTWGGLFVIMLIMGMIAGTLQGVVSLPWYVALAVKFIFLQSGDGMSNDSSILYSSFLYLLGVVQVYGSYIAMILSIIGLSYQYAHAREKADSVTVESDIDKFEQL